MPSEPPPPQRDPTTAGRPQRRRIWDRNLLFFLVCLAGVGVAVGRILTPPPAPTVRSFDPTLYRKAAFAGVVRELDEAMTADWKQAGLNVAPKADDLIVTRRLSLALTGTLPSIQEIRALESQPEDDRIHWWISRLLEDRRHSDYLAERFARAYVGVENGPFLVYRRRRMVSWLSDQIQQNRPYDDLVRNLITAEGNWTSNPEANFLTVTIDPNDKPEEGEKPKGPDEVKLAARVTRAFLGVRLDCVQCHDDKFGDRWKQKDFHQLASFFAQSEVQFTGVQDDPKREYRFRYLRTPEEVVIPPIVPFNQELLPDEGGLRERLATWVTHADNRPFARATVNRVWALLFNKPLVHPIDEIPLDGPWPKAMEILSDDLIGNGFDLHRLVRVIASSRAFQLDSRAPEGAPPVTDAQERAFAAFPVTRLRPEQVAGSVIQSSTLRTINADAHIIQKMKRVFGQGGFVKRYGDLGEDEFSQTGGTIPQRLLLMNGNMVSEQIKHNPVLNASTRIGMVAPDDETAVETAFLATLTRSPTAEESGHFSAQLRGTKGDERSERMADLYWALLNSTEFSWNH